MITLYTHFVNGINLPNTSLSNAEGEALADMITKHETKMLKDILGIALYDLFQTNIAQGSGIYHDLLVGDDYTDSNGLPNKWEGFTTIGRNPIANYIYCQVQENNFTNTMGIGERKGKAENMVADSPARKIKDAWNEMVDWLWTMHDYLIVNKASYTTYIGINYPPYRVGSYNALGTRNVYTSNIYRMANQRYFRYKNIHGI